MSIGEFHGGGGGGSQRKFLNVIILPSYGYRLTYSPQWIIVGTKTVKNAQIDWLAKDSHATPSRKELIIHKQRRILFQSGFKF